MDRRRLVRRVGTAAVALLPVGVVPAVLAAPSAHAVAACVEAPPGSSTGLGACPAGDAATFAVTVAVLQPSDDGSGGSGDSGAVSQTQPQCGTPLPVQAGAAGATLYGGANASGTVGAGAQASGVGAEAWECDLTGLSPQGELEVYTPAGDSGVFSDNTGGS